jgi:uncharacterized protein (DUF58 family)
MKTFTKFGISLTVVSAIAAIGTGVEPLLFFAAAVAFVTLLDAVFNSPMPTAGTVVEAPAQKIDTAVVEAPVELVVPPAPVKRTRARKTTPTLAAKDVPVKKAAPKAAPAKRAPAKAKK